MWLPQDIWNKTEATQGPAGRLILSHLATLFSTTTCHTRKPLHHPPFWFVYISFRCAGYHSTEQNLQVRCQKSSITKKTNPVAFCSDFLNLVTYLCIVWLHFVLLSFEGMKARMEGRILTRRKWIPVLRNEKLRWPIKWTGLLTLVHHLLSHFCTS